jgi:hypothetical protein
VDHQQRRAAYAGAEGRGRGGVQGGLVRRAVAHRRERLHRVAGCAIGDRGVRSHGGEEIRVGSSDVHGHRAARADAGDVHPRGVHRQPRRHLARNRREDRGLAGAARLVGGIVPGPALLRVRSGRLLRPDHDHPAIRGERVHPRAGGEVVGILRAPVQHHQQRRGARGVSAAGTVSR